MSNLKLASNNFIFPSRNRIDNVKQSKNYYLIIPLFNIIAVLYDSNILHGIYGYSNTNIDRYKP